MFHDYGNHIMDSSQGLNMVIQGLFAINGK